MTQNVFIEIFTLFAIRAREFIAQGGSFRLPGFGAFISDDGQVRFVASRAFARAFRDASLLKTADDLETDKSLAPSRKRSSQFKFFDFTKGDQQ